MRRGEPHGRKGALKIAIMATAALITFVGFKSSAPGGAATPSGSFQSAEPREARAVGADICRSARRALRWYSGAEAHWLSKLGMRVPTIHRPASACPRYLWKVIRGRAISARQRWQDHRSLDEQTDWRRAVEEAQIAYPGTRDWLLSCSSSEGGHGRWFPNSQGSGAGGWLQFMESTFWRMWYAAKDDVRSRGFRVPDSADSWYSPLGQALAGAWGVMNGRAHEWSGAGCYRY